MDPLDIEEDVTDLYSDDENPKEKKIANKIIDYKWKSSKIKDSTKMSILSEETLYYNTSMSNILSLKTIITSFIFMGLAMTLQEAYSFTDGNNTVHFFLDSSIVYKCEGGFYSASQILAEKNNNMDYIWGLMVLLALGLTMIFNIYIFPMEAILRMLHHIDFKLGDLTVWVKKKSQEENRFKLLFNIVNRLNTTTKVSEKKRKKGRN
jgi:hypothetical protein